jgi:hypothetical protein
MSLEEFKTFVANRGVDFESLTTNAEKGEWSERFNRFKLGVAPAQGMYNTIGLFAVV